MIPLSSPSTERRLSGVACETCDCATHSPSCYGKWKMDVMMSMWRRGHPESEIGDTNKEKNEHK
jgi:hypothetical protein